MRKIFLIFALVLLFGCKKNKDIVSYASFNINGKTYVANGGMISVMYNYRADTLNLYSYYLMRESYYNNMISDVPFSFSIIDRTLGNKTEFTFPDEVEMFGCEYQGNPYHAISGTVTLIQIGKISENKASFQNISIIGTFDVTLVNMSDETDTIDITNGKYEYNPISYGEAYYH